jgi:hypothetical protein
LKDAEVCCTIDQYVASWKRWGGLTACCTRCIYIGAVLDVQGGYQVEVEVEGEECEGYQPVGPLRSHGDGDLESFLDVVDGSLNGNESAIAGIDGQQK